MKETPLSDEELTRAKDQLKGNILMGLESSNSRMANLARQEMYFQQFFTVEEIIGADRRGAGRPGAGDGAEAVRSESYRDHVAGPSGRHQADAQTAGVLGSGGRSAASLQFIVLSSQLDLVVRGLTQLTSR